MTGARALLLVGVVFLLLVAGLGMGAWWYLSGPNEIDSAELAPGNTVIFLSIPNAVTLLQGYESSHLKTLIDSPDTQPTRDILSGWIGQKNIDLANALLPNLSGQSFIAITNLDYDHLDQIGFVAALKPKPGLDNFDTFVNKLKATWPDTFKQGTTGDGSVLGVHYQWIQGPGAADKICVARVHGWIITTWGEASLQDWIERYRKKSTTSSLADNLNYRKALSHVGDNPSTLVYLDYHAVMDNVQKQLTKTNPPLAAYLQRKIDSLGAIAVGSRFENGEIVDRYSFLVPLPSQVNVGLRADPCAFETLKFTGPDTRFYWAGGMDWKQYFKHIHEQSQLAPSITPANINPALGQLTSFLQNWVNSTTLDPQQNIIDALGSEVSLQVEWSPDSNWPEAGIFVKLDKPDDFKPTIDAIIESVRKAYATSAVINELSSNGHKFATLQFVNPSAISPTITEDGPYLGIFLGANQAVRSFQRNPDTTIDHNPDFTRQIGDKVKTANQIAYLDSPRLLDRGYQTALPYISLAAMLDKNLGGLIKGKTLPPDLSWLGPIGTWSAVVTTDEEGIQVYSTSGIGNQGFGLAAAGNWAIGLLQGMGYIPHAPISGSAAQAAANNPSTTPAPGVSNAPATSATITITAAGRIYFNDALVPYDQIGAYLQAQKNSNPNLKPVVRVDRDSSPDILSRVMDAGATAGFGVLTYTATGGTSPAISSEIIAAPSSTNAAPITNSAPNAIPAIPSSTTAQ
jgi:biopolymer transport protein ExbD